MQNEKGTPRKNLVVDVILVETTQNKSLSVNLFSHRISQSTRTLVRKALSR